MAYLGTKPANQVIDSTLIADGTVTPSDLSTGRPVWDTSGNVGIGTNSPSTLGKLGVVSADSTASIVASGATGMARIYGYNSGSGGVYIDSANAAQSAFLPITINSSTSIFATGGSERMRIDSGGAVLIGTTSQSSPPVAGKVNIVGITSFGQYAGNSQSAIQYMPDTAGGSIFYSKNAGALSWGTGANPYSGNAEYMRLDTSGNLLVNRTTQIASEQLGIGYDGASKQGIYVTDSSSATTVTMIGFYKAGAARGSITSTSSATAYNTSSDYRLKENIAPMTGALDKVAQLKPVTYTWKSDGSDGQGFIAHELQEVVPDCVTGEKDAVDEEGNPRYQGVDTSFLVATLTAAIQEQQQIINDLKARIETLETKE